MENDDVFSPIVGRRQILAGAATLGMLVGLGRSARARPRATDGADEIDLSDLVVGDMMQGMCVLTPSETAGPFYLNLNLVRQDITEGQPGLAMRLLLNVVRASDCTPIPNAAVDAWHNNAAGTYSGFASKGTAGQTWLRGVQFTDANGMATFDTIYPGWYMGRTTHIHLKVRPTPGTELTTQLYFEQPLNRRVNSIPPYAAHGQNPTTNFNDSLFLPETVMTLLGVNPVQMALTIAVA